MPAAINSAIKGAMKLQRDTGKNTWQAMCAPAMLIQTCLDFFCVFRATFSFSASVLEFAIAAKTC